VPLSIWLGLEDCLGAISTRRPRTILDAGIGFGTFGQLLRQYLDVWEGRIRREDWHVTIDGIELVPERVLPHQRYIYDRIAVGDIRELVPQLASGYVYDAILFGDVLEHLPKGDATQLLKTAVALARHFVLIRIPLGNGWRERGRARADDHLSKWEVEDFARFVAEITVYDFYGHDYGQIAIDAPASRALAIESLGQTLATLEEQLNTMLEEQPC